MQCGTSLDCREQKWFYGQRAYPRKTIAPGKLLHAERQAAAIRQQSVPSGAAATPTAPTAPLNWSSFGPRPIAAGSPSIYNGAAPWSGRVTAIAHSPTNAAVAYLGAADGGVWKTTDSGQHWNPVFDVVGGGRAPSLAIGSIGINPQNASTIYVGTGEANGCCDSYFGAGIFRSKDAGSTWSKIGGSTFNNCHVSNVVVKPGSSGSTIFAAVGNEGIYETTCPSGIWRSDNGGTNWTYEISGPVTDLVSKPGTPNTWYAGFVGAGVWRSNNGGDHWDPLAGGLPTANIGRVALAVTPDNPSRVYAAIEDSRNRKTLGTWTSVNSGTDWTALPYTNYCGYTNGGTSGQCSYDLTAAAYPGNQSFLYVGGIRLQRYDGSSWTTLGYDGQHTTGIHVDFHAAGFDTSNRLWVGSDGGAYRKDSGSTPFTNLNATLGISQFEPGITGHPNRLFLGGTQDNGSLQYTPSGGWYELEVGDGGYTAYDGTNGYKFTTYVNATVNRDPGGDCLFTTLANQSDVCPYVNEPSLFYAPLVRSPSNPATLFVGTNRIWKSTNDGSLWTAESPQFTGTDGKARVSAIDQATSDSRVLYAAWSSDRYLNTNNTGPNFVALTTNANAQSPNWTATADLPERFITDIAVKRTAPNVAWVTLSGYNTGHVYVTQDYGDTWTPISGNLPNAPVNAIAADSRTSPSTLYVATDVGVFWSTDGGSTWANTSTGLPNSVVMDIRVDTPTNQLVAATHGRGAFTAPIP